MRRAATPEPGAKLQFLERYFDALRSQAWERLGESLAENVHRTGPYLDVVEGRKAYVDFLARVVPSLPGYELVVRRIRWLDDGAALVELTESLDQDGGRTEYPEALLFEFDDDARIRRVDVYIKQPPANAPQ